MMCYYNLYYGITHFLELVKVELVKSAPTPPNAKSRSIDMLPKGGGVPQERVRATATATTRTSAEIFHRVRSKLVDEKRFDQKFDRDESDDAECDGNR